MELKLKVRVGSNKGQELRIQPPKFFIGRAEDCHLRPKSDLISRHHCVIMIDESAVVIRDLGSRNGTLVNAERITGERELKSGDQICVGPLEFEVVFVENATSKKLPKVTSIKEAAARTAAGRLSEDEDFTHWLSEEPPTPETAPGGTVEQSQGASETEEIQLETTIIDEAVKKPTETSPAIPRPKMPQPKMPEVEATVYEAPEASDTESTSTPEKPHRATGKPGKLPRLPRQTSGDSREAAADVLRKLFHRR